MQNFFKRGAVGGPFYQKCVVPHFKKVKCVTFKTDYKLNLGPTSKFWAQNEAESVYLMIQ